MKMNGFVFRILVLLVLLTIFFMEPGLAENPRRRRFYRDAQFPAIQNYSLSDVIIQNVSVKDSLECVHICLEHSHCVSVNYKTAGNPDHLCELCNQTLESSKPENKISRPGYIHFGPTFPPICLNSTCKNGGTCSYIYGGISRHLIDYKCVCNVDTSGRHCEQWIGPAYASCQDIIKNTGNHEMEDGVYPVSLNSATIDVYCIMKSISGCSNNGGWTFVMKADPNNNTFAYDSNYWSNKIPYNLAAGKTGFDFNETKLPSYWSVPFKEICVGFKVDESLKFTAIPYDATSLYDVIADGIERRFSIGKAAWKSLIPGSSLQNKCIREGFNVKVPYGQSLRLGIITDDYNTCKSTADSFLGFAQNKFPVSYNHGNVCNWPPCDTQSLEYIPAFGYILVR